MKPRSLASLGMLAACATLLAGAALGRAAQPAPHAPAQQQATLTSPSNPTPSARPKRKLYVDGVLDTGQFLPDTAALGSINGRPITVREFVETYFNAYAPDRPVSDSAGRVQWLHSIVNKTILGTVAKRVNRPYGFEERVQLREHTERVLSNVLFVRAVTDSVTANDAEVRAVYDREFHTEYHLKHIMLSDRGPCEEVLRMLRAKTLTWSEAVKRYSTATKRDAGPDGNLGWVQRLGMGWSMSQALLKMKPGEIQGPLGDADGYHIVELVARRNVEAPAFESVERSIRLQLRSRDVQARAAVLVDQLRQQAHMQYDSTNIAWATKFFRPTIGHGSGAPGDPDLQINTTVPVFSPADTARTLARYKDGVVSLGRMTRAYMEISPLARPGVHTFAGMVEMIDGVALEPYRAEMALERGLDKDSMAVALIEKKKEQIAVERMYQDSIEARIQVTDAERRKYYNDKIAQFVTYPSAHYGVLLANDSLGAAVLATRLRGGEKLEGILRADSLAGRGKTGGIYDERENMNGAFHALLFQEMKPGNVEVMGPDKNGKWAAIQLLAFDPGQQLSYEEGRGYADDHVRSEKAEAMLQDLIDRHRREFRIELRPELVMHVRMLDPAVEH